MALTVVEEEEEVAGMVVEVVVEVVAVVIFPMVWGGPARIRCNSDGGDTRCSVGACIGRGTYLFDTACAGSGTFFRWRVCVDGINAAAGCDCDACDPSSCSE